MASVIAGSKRRADNSRPLSPYCNAIYQVMDFEWDPAKRVSNLAKHGIDFPAASRVFADPILRIEIDPRNYGREIRFRAIGSVEGTVLFVCFTMRDEACRIISARRANRGEREIYSLSARDRFPT
jgi:uncharacterized protein